MVLVTSDYLMVIYFPVLEAYLAGVSVVSLYSFKIHPFSIVLQVQHQSTKQNFIAGCKCIAT